MLNMWDEFDRLWADMDRLARRTGGARGGVVRPALRIRETEEAYHVSADVPGVPLENLDVEATNHLPPGTTGDHQEAARAFVEKREPRFSGR